MDPRQIDLSEWTLSGGGAQGESYYNEKEPGKLLKLFTSQIKREIIETELELSIAIERIGVPCPKPGEFVRAGDRLGIIFEKIPNKVSFCTAISHDPSCCEDMARRLAVMAKKLHSTPSTDSSFASMTEYYTKALSVCTMDDDMRSRMESALELSSVSDTHTLVHGDFHFGNAITDGVNDYFIDLGAFGYGNPDFDNSMLYFVCLITPDVYRFENYHIHGDKAAEFWNFYKRYYYGDDAPSDEEFGHRFAPYLLLRTLFFERDLGHDKVVDILRNQIIQL